MSKPVILEGLQQGSREWLEVRSQHHTASEAPIMMGASKYVGRNELLRQKATGYVPEVDANKQRLFDIGHESEASARPIIEAQISDDLYPVTITNEIDGMKLLASMDGLTMDGKTGWEHKLLSTSLETQVLNEALEPHYYWQLEAQMLTSGAERIIFTTSDGTAERMASMTYKSVPARRAQLIAGWKQFDEDLANYKHQEVIPAAVAAPITDLPALNIQISGSVVASNLAQWKDVVVARISDISTDLKTDTDFATAESTVKFLDEGEKKIDLVKAQAQSQASDIDSVFRAMDEIKAMMRSKRLELDKLVKSRKENIRMEIMQEGQDRLVAHAITLNKRLGGMYIASAADFSGAIKGKRTISSLRDAIDTELSRAKIAANELADRIQCNKTVMTQLCDPDIIFPDFPQVCTKDPSDFANLVAIRVGQHKEAEEKRLEVERERIRIEEERKANAKAREAAMPKVIEAIDHGDGIKTIVIANTPPEGPDAARVSSEDGIEATPALGQRETSDDGKLVSISDLNCALGFTVTSDFLASLGFTATHIKAAKLYKASEYGSICAAIVKHIKNTSVAQRRAKGRAGSFIAGGSPGAVGCAAKLTE